LGRINGLHSANWTVALLLQPLIRASCVKYVKATQRSSVVADFEILHADGAGHMRTALFNGYLEA